MITNLQVEHAELEEKFAELQKEVKALRARNAELEKLIARKPEDAETERFHRGMKFKRGPKTGGQWMPFCPKCGLPVNDVVLASENRWALCSAHCGWTGVPLEIDMP